MSKNSPDFVPTVLGCSSAGITPALLNTAMKGRLANISYKNDSFESMIRMNP